MPEKLKSGKILLVGAGPVIIGQAGELDHAGTQACKALKEEGYQVTVINSNPATMMTDYRLAEKVYIEPLTENTVEKIIYIEKPDVLLVGFGGQTALNLGSNLFKTGILQKHGVRLAGISERAIQLTEDYEKFKATINDCGLKTPAGNIAKNVQDGLAISKIMKPPLVVRPFGTLEGVAVSVAYNQEELMEYLEKGLTLSPIHQVLVEEALLGWKELEFEVLRDINGACMVVGSLENIDANGVHPGDSAVVIPAQTLTEAGLQKINGLCESICKAFELTGNINLKFVQNPATGEFLLIKINPRFTRSAALVTKTTGIQIARIAAKLALGHPLPGHIKSETEATQINTANHEAKSGHVGVRLPRFDQEKFPATDPVLNTLMKSTGETLAIGCNFKEAFQKAIRSLAMGRYGFGADGKDLNETKLSNREIKEKIVNPNAERYFYLRYALKAGMTVSEISNLSKIDDWFINEFAQLTAFEKKLTTYALYNLPGEVLLQAKQWGYSDLQIGYLLRCPEDEVRQARMRLGVKHNYSRILAEDTLGSGEESYLYSTFNAIDQIKAVKGNKVMVIGSGPNYIGQGIEFNYSAAHAVLAIQELGYECVIVDNNPASVTTDYDLGAKLYFDPLTREDILNIIEIEEPTGVVLQFAGDRGLELAPLLSQTGVKILGTGPDYQNLNVSRAQLIDLAKKTGLPSLGSEVVIDLKSALESASRLGYPVTVKPVNLPGNQMAPRSCAMINLPVELQEYFDRKLTPLGSYQVFIEKLIDEAIGVEAYCIGDGDTLVICGVTEQVEEALIHPGDSAISFPPFSLGKETLAKIRWYAGILAKELGLRGLAKLQFVIKHDAIYLKGISLMAGSFLPLLSKASGINWPEAATKVMLGVSLQEQGLESGLDLKYNVIREAVFSFERFPEEDVVLGPEMRSTGEVMGIDWDFGAAFIKAQLAAGEKIPTSGSIFLSIRDEDKRAFASIAKQLVGLGFTILTTEETASMLSRNNIHCQIVCRVGEGRPNIIDKIKNGEVQWIINTPSGRKDKQDESLIRRTAISRGIPMITTVAGAQAIVSGLDQYLNHGLVMREIREYFK